ncbi:hypothetical protein CEE37_03820 [candidate division LCP-89 bacterium B3_LCP]|uniref:CBS domain-containing protein n=1 Tax=candidate division LCP-89 bacterium B3_LCP TaxID=2012998 RepID=A0A532V3A7_UNCL8|nr:MAG: hypothetical protein CEE37_03820 [candidate division LCP-89 bacterium B3_LCP]
MKLKKIRDLMLPLDRYAVVPEESTMLDALYTLEEAQKKLPEDVQPVRSVLVVDDKKRIIGKLGHLAFLRGLEPKYDQMGDLGTLSRAGWTSNFISSMMTDMHLWGDTFGDYVNNAKKTQVKTVMHPVEENIDIDAPLSEAVHKIVMYQTLSIIVKEGDEVVGILRLADLFNEITTKMLQYVHSEESGE